MDLRQLRYLLAIADSGSLTRAAEQIPLAQSALSRHIRLLETELKTALLIRTGRGVQLTEQGEFLCERARALLEQVEDTRQSLLSWYDNPAGVVRVGMPPSPILSMASPVLQAMAGRYDQVTVRLSEGLSANLVDWVDSGRLDIAVVLEEQGGALGHCEKIGSEELCLVVPAGFACSDPVTLDAVAKMSVIAPFRRNGIRQRITRAFEQAAIPFEPVWEIDALAAIKEMVRSGAGVSLLARSAVQREVERGEMETRRIAAPDLTFDVFLLYSKAALHSRAAAAIAQVIREVSATVFTASDAEHS